MRTDKQRNASKNNGQKSSGPVTPEGKAKSAQNAVSHNLCTGQLVVLSNEDPCAFQHHENHYFDRFQPLDGVERDLVHKMIAASWREKRIAAMESALFELEMDRQRPDIAEEFAEINPEARQVLTLFGTSDATAAANLLLRYAAAVRRAYTSAYRILKDVQGDRFNRKPAGLSPETHTGSGDNHSKIVAATEASANEAAADAQQAIIIVRRRPEHYIRPAHTAKNTKLRNEPKAAAAGARPVITAIAKAASASFGTVPHNENEQHGPQDKPVAAA